jgi:hypothetical protein
MSALEPTLLRPGRRRWVWTIGQAASRRPPAALVMLFGRPQAAGSEAWLITAVLYSPAAGLRVLRSRAAHGARYPALTAHFPAAQMAERELWEQTGVQPEAHPWLKPVRFEGERQQHMDAYPFFVVRGQEVHEVGVGPIHASVIEPGHFRFMCHGERVQHLEIQLGYQHRGVEALLLQRPPLALTPLVESIAGDTSIAYAWGYCAAIEALSGVVLAPPVERVRAVALELERIAMHLVALTGWPPTSPSCRAAPPTAGCAPRSSTPRNASAATASAAAGCARAACAMRSMRRAGRTCSTRWRPSRAISPRSTS